MSTNVTTGGDDEPFYCVDDSDEEYVDIISELSQRFPHIIAQILQYLTVRELSSAYCVSKSWSNALHDSTDANKRRVKHLKKVMKFRKRVGKENWSIKRRTPVPANTRRDALSDIRNDYRIRKQPKGLSAHSMANSTQTPNTKHEDMALRVSLPGHFVQKRDN